jgi:hypothetical protein
MDVNMEPEKSTALEIVMKNRLVKTKKADKALCVL